MTNIPDIARKVPMMFRAQINGRCQLQRIDTERSRNEDAQDAELWVYEWIDKAYPNAPTFDAGVQTHIFKINWRFVTNGGQDDGIIRPVIGAYGWPFYPGSSMKGIFRNACTPDQANRYCGNELQGGDFEPGILRFHGGYPTTTEWTDGLIDIIHPQQVRQVQQEKRTSAFAQISLYQPEMRFGISSVEALDNDEWKTIWKILEKGLSHGIGCRVSAGYGQIEDHTGRTLYSCGLKGQGQAPKLLDGTGEFRPNVFRAAIRGHALRLFGGLTDVDIAEGLVNNLFGSVRGSGDVGLLSISFQTHQIEMDSYGRDRWEQPTYDVEGDLYWMLNHPLDNPDQRKPLINLIRSLTRFAMVLGGFGKSWRRADHRIFYPDYAEQDYKPLIGCHWQWNGEDSLRYDVRIRKLEQLSSFIDSIRDTALEWINVRGISLQSGRWADDWREAWHPDSVQVWGRVAESAEDCMAARWLHSPYREAIPSARIREGSIYRSSVTGQMGQIGRLWHRMYPVVGLKKRKDDPKGKPIPVRTSKYFELLTLFPDSSTEYHQFLQFLENEQQMFVKLWPQ